MKITAVETIRLREFGNLIWVRIHTDQGQVGLGETFMGASAVEAYLHDVVAPKLLGKDSLQIEARNRELSNYLGWGSAGVETRLRSRCSSRGSPRCVRKLTVRRVAGLRGARVFAARVLGIG